MVKTISFVCFILLSLPSFCQKKLPEFGKPDSSELQLTSCIFEPSANALKLFDIQEIEFEPSPFGGKIRTEKRVRIKIFNEKGFPKASVTIPFYSNKKNTKIDELKGVIYNTDNSGKISTQKLEEADFYRDKAMEKIGLIRFTFPNLKAGSVIEYSYTISEKNRLYIDPWIIQSDIPVAYTAASVIIPSYSLLKEYVFGRDSISQKKELLTKGLDKQKKTFYIETVPSFQPEPLMSSDKDNLLRMGFSFFPEGNAFAQDITPQSAWRMAGSMILRLPVLDQELKKVIPGTEKIIDTALTILYTPDRIQYLFNAVKKRFPENTGQTAAPDEIDNIWKSRTGTSAQINLLLLNFLQRAYIKCHPILVSTRENGKINMDFPNFGQFNGIDVLALDKDYYYVLDASSKFQSYDFPPVNILNRNAFLLDPDNIRWIKITDDKPLIKQSVSVFGMINNSGILEGSAAVKYYDFAKSLILDSAVKGATEKEEKIFDPKIQGLKVLADKQENINSDDPLLQTVEFDFSIPESGDFYFINPLFFSSKKINPFTSEIRKTEIDFWCNQEFSTDLQLEIPGSYAIESLPKNIVVRSPDSSFIYTRIVSTSSSTISFSQELKINKAVFDKSEYPDLYDFYRGLGAIIAEEIILKKKK